MTKHLTAPEHSTCKGHERYWLTCDQYEDLIALNGNRCHACGADARSCRPHKKLFIDHDQGYGVWAVRGLLCPRCNGACRTDRPDPEWARDYLADPWFKKAFAALGVPIEPLPEPPIGSVFRSPRRTSWQREASCWRNTSFARATRTWRGMCMDFSPVHLREIRHAVVPPDSVTITLRPREPWSVAEVLRTHMTLEQRRELVFLISG